MRVTGLLAVVLFLVIVLFAAPAASHAQATSASPATTAKMDTPKLSLPFAAHPLDEDSYLRGFADAMELERDGACYTMRTYVMAREERDSDVTHMVRYRKCLPAWKLQFKSATEERSSRREK